MSIVSVVYVDFLYKVALALQENVGWGVAYAASSTLPKLCIQATSCFITGLPSKAGVEKGE